MATTGDGFVLELRGGVDAGSAARQAVAESAVGLPELLQTDVMLLVSELVTNAVRHADVGPDGSLQLECRRDGDRLRVLVTDPGTDLLSGGRPVPVARPTNGDGASSGWGLYLVEQVAERWGVFAAPAGTCVWFEVAG